MPLEPHTRWRRYGTKPDYAGLLTFGGAPYTEDSGELAEFDVAIIGAPMDDLVSDRPGTRMAPRAIRAASGASGTHLETGVDAFEVLRIVDYGDAGCVPGNPEANHAAIRELIDEVLVAGVFPMVLGGDHSIAEPTGQAHAAKFGSIGLAQFDAHTDTGELVYGSPLSHGTPMRHLIEDGHVAGERYVQIGLRGYWPGEKVFAWQRERGIVDVRAHELRELGIDAVTTRVVRKLGSESAYLSVDIDVLEPALLGPGGTGAPEPGGMALDDLLGACRRIAAEANLVGAEIVEVIPTEHGTASLSALAANRIACEVLTGLALRRSSLVSSTAKRPIRLPWGRSLNLAEIK